MRQNRVVSARAIKIPQAQSINVSRHRLRVRHEDDPATFIRTLLEVLEAHALEILERITPDQFAAAGPLDLVQGAVTPVTRQGFVELGSGRYARSRQVMCG